MPCPKTLSPRAALPYDFGRQVWAARKANRWSQERLALKVGVSRRTITRLERGTTVASERLVHALMRDDVLRDFALIKGWEIYDPEAWPRGFRARAARIASGQTLAAVVAKAGGSIASLSSFERGLLAPVAYTGCAVQDDDGDVGNIYACALGFANAADMIEYLEADDPMPWLVQIAAACNRPLPAAARLPVRRARLLDDDDEFSSSTMT